VSPVQFAQGGPVYLDAAMTKPLRLYVPDVERGGQPVECELSVRGRTLLLTPVAWSEPADAQVNGDPRVAQPAG
jgi:hypothetical protein